MRTLHESLFAPQRKRNYLFEYLYLSLAVSVSVKWRCQRHCLPLRKATACLLWVDTFLMRNEGDLYAR